MRLYDFVGAAGGKVEGLGKGGEAIVIEDTLIGFIVGEDEDVLGVCKVSMYLVIPLKSRKSIKSSPILIDFHVSACCWLQEDKVVIKAGNALVNQPHEGSLCILNKLVIDH